MPHDPTPSAITIISDLYFTDVECIKVITETDEWDVNLTCFDLNKISLQDLYNYLVYPFQQDICLIKVYFKDGHPFNTRYPTLGRAEFSLNGLKRLAFPADLTTPPPTL